MSQLTAVNVCLNVCCCIKHAAALSMLFAQKADQFASGSLSSKEWTQQVTAISCAGKKK